VTVAAVAEEGEIPGEEDEGIETSIAAVAEVLIDEVHAIRDHHGDATLETEVHSEAHPGNQTHMCLVAAEDQDEMTGQDPLCQSHDHHLPAVQSQSPVLHPVAVIAPHRDHALHLLAGDLGHQIGESTPIEDVAAELEEEVPTA